MVSLILVQRYSLLMPAAEQRWCLKAIVPSVHGNMFIQPTMTLTTTMSSRTRQADAIIIARSKRTGERYPVRLSHLAGQYGNQDVRLHYTNSTRSEICRCPAAQDHERPHAMIDEERSLMIATTRYMDKFGLESCHTSFVHRYRERQKIEWAPTSFAAEYVIQRFKSSVLSFSFLKRHEQHAPKLNGER